MTWLLFACCRSAVLRAVVPVLPAALRSFVHLPRRVQDAAQGASLRHVPPVSLLLCSHGFGPAHGHGHPHPLPAAGLLHGPPALHRCCLLFQLLHCNLDHAGKLTTFFKHLQQHCYSLISHCCFCPGQDQPIETLPHLVLCLVFVLPYLFCW